MHDLPFDLECPRIIVKIKKDIQSWNFMEKQDITLERSALEENKLNVKLSILF